MLGIGTPSAGKNMKNQFQNPSPKSLINVKNELKLDAFKNSENIASELPVGRQNGIQTALRRDPGTPHDDQNPPLEAPDPPPSIPKVAPKSHFGRLS